VENLLENAIHYTPDNGNVRITLGQSDGEITVHVQDTGAGIEKDELPHIFDRFYRSAESRKDQTGHSGLGLAIAKRILELHERPIAVTSEPGSGTTFSFHLPIAAERL
jgi:signal transduction histidine kinase